MPPRVPALPENVRGRRASVPCPARTARGGVPPAACDGRSLRLVLSCAHGRRAVTEDAKRILYEFADGESFGVTAVRRLLTCRTARAERALHSLVTTGMVLRVRGNERIYKLTPFGRNLGESLRPSE